MKPKAIAAFVMVVFGVSAPGAYRQGSYPHSAHERTAQARAIAEIADPANVSPTAGTEQSVGSSMYTIALLVPAVFLAGFWMYCLLRAAQAARACLTLCRTRPWFLNTQPVLGRGFALVIILVLLPAQGLFSRDIYFDYSVSADSDLYKVGDEVSWSISASVEGDTRGIKAFDVSLYESRNEEVEAPATAPFFRPEFQLMLTQFFSDGKLTSDFNYKNFFEVTDGGSGGAGGIYGLGVSQFVDHTHPKFLDALEFTSGSLCEGKYTVTKAGFHGLYVGHNYGSVWIDESGNVYDNAIPRGTDVGF